MKLKVCGMTQPENIKEIAKLQPNFMGFIFYKNSSRYFKGTIPVLPKTIKKVGVFVNSPLNEVLALSKDHQLDVLQLHGQETPEYCRRLKQSVVDHKIEIIKVFSVKTSFDFNKLKTYEPFCDYFLFDTKGKLPGGNGETFNWTLLNQYTSNTPFFLSGGIGLNQIKQLKQFMASKAAERCYAIDVNSRFETAPGIKNKNELEKLNYELQH